MPAGKLRSQALRIFRAALDASDPGRAILHHVRISGRFLIAGGRRYNL